MLGARTEEYEAFDINDPIIQKLAESSPEELVNTVLNTDDTKDEISQSEVVSVVKEMRTSDAAAAEEEFVSSIDADGAVPKDAMIAYLSGDGADLKTEERNSRIANVLTHLGITALDGSPLSADSPGVTELAALPSAEAIFNALNTEGADGDKYILPSEASAWAANSESIAEADLFEKATSNEDGSRKVSTDDALTYLSGDGKDLTPEEYKERISTLLFIMGVRTDDNKALAADSALIEELSQKSPEDLISESLDINENGFVEKRELIDLGKEVSEAEAEERMKDMVTSTPPEIETDDFIDYISGVIGGKKLTEEQRGQRISNVLHELGI